ncbi:hypothetical protein [Hydrocarboniphaga effusa]|jgi:hypothetical protein|uniref:hypothetical protein n=1 Tax=Hydrocarboniphaga effusa TaxID=243629 RepID=UPI00313827C4
MAQQQHRGPEARKIELERRLDENEKTVSRGLASDQEDSEKKNVSGQQQQSGGPDHRGRQGSADRSTPPGGGKLRQDRKE